MNCSSEALCLRGEGAGVNWVWSPSRRLPPGGNVLDWEMGLTTVWLLEGLGGRLVRGTHPARWQVIAEEKAGQEGGCLLFESLIPGFPFGR